MAPVHQITPGRTIDASSGASENIRSSVIRDHFANRLKKLSLVPLRPRRPVGHLGDDRQVDLAEILRGLAIDRLIQVVARRVIPLGAPPLDDLVLGESLVKPTFSDSAGTPVLMKLY